MLIDRVDKAIELAKGKKVLDLGGALMPDSDPKDTFAQKYYTIKNAAKSYNVIDYQQKPSVDYVLDFNIEDDLHKLRNIIDDVKPELILCMETLEHVNYHFEIMCELARSVELYGTTVLISIPNNENWLISFMKWDHDHVLTFFRDTANRFIRRSPLGKFHVEAFDCIGKYKWWWPLVYVLSGFKPISFGFIVSREKGLFTEFSG